MRETSTRYDRPYRPRAVALFNQGMVDDAQMEAECRKLSNASVIARGSPALGFWVITRYNSA